MGLLFAQNLQMHAHSLDHGPIQHHDSQPEVIDGEHGNVELLHLSIDTSHADHHDVSVVEKDAFPDAVFQTSSIKVSPVDLFILVFSLAILGTCFLHLPSTTTRLTYFLPNKQFDLFPLLRAPPL